MTRVARDGTSTRLGRLFGGRGGDLAYGNNPIALVADKMWVPLSHGGEGVPLTATLVQVDADTGRQVGSSDLGRGAIVGAVARGNDVVTASLGDGRVMLFAPGVSSPALIARLGRPIVLLAADDHIVWAIGQHGEVTRIDPERKSLTEVRQRLGRIVQDAVVVDGELWVAHGPGQVHVVSADGHVRDAGIAGRTVSMEWCAGRLWLAQPHLRGATGGAPGLRIVDPTGRVDSTRDTAVPTGMPLGLLACDGDGLWALGGPGSGEDASLVRIDPGLLGPTS